MVCVYFVRGIGKNDKKEKEKREVSGKEAKKYSGTQTNKNLKNKAKVSLGQKVLGKMYVVQEQVEKREKELDKKSGLTRAQRDKMKYDGVGLFKRI